MFAPLGTQSLNVHSLQPVARFAGLLAPPNIGGTGATGSLAPSGQVDPLAVGIALVAFGVTYALVLLVAIRLLHRSHRLKWLAEANRADQPDGNGVGHPAHSHRPLEARRAAGTHAPLPGATSATTATTAQVRSSGASTPVPGAPGAPGAPAPRTPAWLDTTAWRPVAYEVPEVGVVQLDARTVRTFAGQPEVLRRLAFQRWRYQAGHCSEFTVPEGTARGAGGASGTGSGTRAARNGGNEGDGGRAGGTRPHSPPADARPSGLPGLPGHISPVPHPADGEAH